MITVPLIWYSAISGILLYILFKVFLKERHGENSLLPYPPGPRPWPVIGNLPQLGTMPHQSLAAMAKTYGPLMQLRLGYVNVVVAASASVAMEFLKKHDANFSNRPPNSGAKHMAYNYQDMVFAPYGPRWRLLRKICSVHLFSAKALDDFHRVREVSLYLHMLSSHLRNFSLNFF